MHSFPAGFAEKQTGRFTDTVFLNVELLKVTRHSPFAEIVDLHSFYREAFKQQIQSV